MEVEASIMHRKRLNDERVSWVSISLPPPKRERQSKKKNDGKCMKALKNHLVIFTAFHKK